LVFDPKSRTFSKFGKMLLARSNQASTRLWDGNILISGGCIQGRKNDDLVPTERCELFDPTTGKSKKVGSMSEPKAGHAAGLVSWVLTYGGLSHYGDSPMPCATMEIYYPDKATWGIYDHPKSGVVNAVLFQLPNGSLFSGGSEVEFDPAKRDKHEDGVKPIPTLCH